MDNKTNRQHPVLQWGHDTYFGPTRNLSTEPRWYFTPPQGVKDLESLERHLRRGLPLSVNLSELCTLMRQLTVGIYEIDEDLSLFAAPQECYRDAWRGYIERTQALLDAYGITADQLFTQICDRTSEHWFYWHAGGVQIPEECYRTR